MENTRLSVNCLTLPKYVFPISLLCFGYPTAGQKERQQTSRFDEKFILFENHYHRLDRAELDEMFHADQEKPSTVGRR